MTVGSARFALSVALAGCVGCTLFSGWSDLQGGAPAADASPGAGTPGDSGADSAAGQTNPPPGSDSGARPDSSTPSPDASSVLMTVACGTKRCPLGEGCCAGIVTEPSTCQTGTQTCTPPGALESCSDSSQCTASLGHSAFCCQDDNGAVPTVSCLTSCPGIGNVVCDPTLASPSCPAGTTCQSNVDGYSYYTCQ